MARRPQLMPAENVVAEVPRITAKARRMTAVSGNVTVTDRRLLLTRTAASLGQGAELRIPLEQITSVTVDRPSPWRARVDVATADRTYRLQPYGFNQRKRAEELAAALDNAMLSLRR